MDERQAIFHTMMISFPDPVAPAPTDPMEIQQLALEVLPSPSRRASTPRQNSLEPEGPDPHSVQASRQTFPEPQSPDPNTVQVSSLIIGSSASAEEQQPVVMQQGDLKASGSVTAGQYHIMSDKQLKHDITPLDFDAAAILHKLQIVQYKLNADPQGRRQIGVVAQDVAQVLEDAVIKDTATNLQSVKLDLLQFVAIRALQQYLPTLIELDKQRRLGLPLLMHAQQQAAQRATTQCQQNLSAADSDTADSECSCESHIPDMDISGMECNSNSCQSEDHQPSSSSSVPAIFKDDAAMVAHILAALKEDNKGISIKILKLLGKLGKDAVWRTHLEAQYTRLPTADGNVRSPGSTFLHLLKKQEQEAKIT